MSGPLIRQNGSALIVVQGMRLAAVGVGVGLAGALALSRFMTSLLSGVTPADLPTYAGMAVVLRRHGVGIDPGCDVVVLPAGAPE